MTQPDSNPDPDLLDEVTKFVRLAEEALSDDEEQEPGPWTTGTCMSGEACWCRTVISSRIDNDSPISSERGKPAWVVGDASLDRAVAEYMTRVRTREPQLARAVIELSLLLGYSREGVGHWTREAERLMHERDAALADVTKLRAALSQTPM